MTLKRLFTDTQNVKGLKKLKVEINNALNKQEIHVYGELQKSHSSKCPICGKKCTGYDSSDSWRVWRGLDMGTYKIFFHIKTRRVECPEHGVHAEMVPWAHYRSKFTKAFEQHVAYFAVNTNRKLTSKICRIAWNTVGEIVTRVAVRIEPDRSKRFKNLKRIGIDETSYKKGHRYITVVVDHDTNQVIWVHDGIGKDVLDNFFAQLTPEEKASINLASADGANWIKSSIEKHLPNAQRCIDLFHMIGWANDAMDEVRKEIWREENKAKKAENKGKRGRPPKGEKKEKLNRSTYAKGYKYAIGKNPENLTEYQANCLDEIRTKYPKLFRAYMLKEGLRGVAYSNPEETEKLLKEWLAWASRCRLKPMVELGRKIRRHKEALLATVNSGLSNARIESMNNKIKGIIRRAYGFRNIENLISMILICCSDMMDELVPVYEGVIE
jgi:transposase